MSGLILSHGSVTGLPHVWLRAVLVLVCLFSGIQLQAGYEAGLEAYQQGDFQGAYAEWIKEATAEDGSSPPEIRAESQYALGMLYWLGQGVEQSTSTAAVWLQEAAELHHAGAQSKLGYLYLSGQGVPRSDFEAFKWLQMAALQGDADAQYNLGVMYRDGLGVETDLDLAKKWFAEAAANGDAVSAQVLENWPADSIVAEETLPPAPESPETTPPETETAVQKVGIEQGETWIRQRDPEHFTIQIIALRSTEKMLEFIENHPDWEPFAIYEQKLKGQPLFVLIQGDYANADAAREAQKTFPAGLQKKEELWIRKFIMVQGLLQ